ncbi:MAG: XRE family transcriptional regulator [Chitinophagaceae bacterium]|nr:MAG: XRE family transcriptional regulator [Chitinophagaceae bacterium]
MKIGKNIAELREAQKITVEHMAAGLKINVEEYRAIENDNVDITLSRLEAIAKLLSIDAADLILFNRAVGGIRNFFFNQTGNTGININIQGLDQEQLRKAYKELYLSELERVPRLEKLLREHNIPFNF